MKNFEFKVCVKDGAAIVVIEDDHMSISFNADEQRLEENRAVLKSISEGMKEAPPSLKTQLSEIMEQAGFKAGAAAKTEQAPETATSPEEAPVVYVLQEPRTYRPRWIVKEKDIEKSPTKKGWAKFNGENFRYMEITSPHLLWGGKPGEGIGSLQ